MSRTFTYEELHQATVVTVAAIFEQPDQVKAEAMADGVLVLLSLIRSTMDDTEPDVPLIKEVKHQVIEDVKKLIEREAGR